MIIEIDAKCNCFDCDKTFDAEDLIGLCGKCFEKRMLVGLVEKALDEVSENKYEWEDRELYVGFDNEEQKDTFLSGVKKGYSDALFWMADYFGLVEYFENNIHGKFYPSEENSTDE